MSYRKKLTSPEDAVGLIRSGMRVFVSGNAATPTPLLKALAARINAFAVSEDLPAHGECVLSRFVKDPYDKATLREQEKEAGLR